MMMMMMMTMLFVLVSNKVIVLAVVFNLLTGINIYINDNCCGNFRLHEIYEVKLFQGFHTQQCIP